jgi:hypothetical protein
VRCWAGTGAATQTNMATARNAAILRILTERPFGARPQPPFGAPCASTA